MEARRRRESEMRRGGGTDVMTTTPMRSSRWSGSVVLLAEHSLLEHLSKNTGCINQLLLRIVSYCGPC